MTVTEAIVKLRNDIISWCTLNFKNKVDVSTTNAMQSKLDTLEVHPTHTARSLTSAINLTVNEKGHVTNASAGTFVNQITPKITSGHEIATGKKTALATSTNFSLYSPTITELCKTDTIILTKDLQYGDQTPSNPVNGQLFFLKVQE